MAIGTQFASLITDLRSELRRSSDVSLSFDDTDSLKRSINGVYRTLVVQHDWPHLRKVFDKIPLVAGQRLYDAPTGLSPDRVLDAVIWLGSLNFPIKRGLNFDTYSFLDPANNQRADPVLGWEMAFDPVSGKTQIEVWPIPASNNYQNLQFSGYWTPGRLVNNTDVCLLDDELILLFASARMLKSQKADDAELKLQEAQGYLLKLTQRAKGNSEPVQVGLGAHIRDRALHPNIVIKPSGG